MEPHLGGDTGDEGVAGAARNECQRNAGPVGARQQPVDGLVDAAVPWGGGREAHIVMGMMDLRRGVVPWTRLCRSGKEIEREKIGCKKRGIESIGGVSQNSGKIFGGRNEPRVEKIDGRSEKLHMYVM